MWVQVPLSSNIFEKRHSEIGITIVSEAIIIGSNPVVSNKKEFVFKLEKN